MITKYGYGTFSVVLVFCLILFALGIFVSMLPLKIFLFSLSSFLLLFSINFFRDPERTSPNRNDVIVSPADGRILFVKDVDANKFLNEKGKQISVFMSPLNVHVNRIPIDGKVDFLEYHKGEYIVAYDDKASERNERSEIGITSKYGKVFFTQIAGYVARRIVYSDIKLGDSVKMGNRFGMIKFGSRSDIVVSNDWIVKVKKDDIVRAGETILFEYKSGDSK
ncbi:MAG: phosphatidylserine decarboxylase family protein [Chlorobiaceae bacterium]|nr:phosphatidylserine decarboxylase family protein [Chlorobiaceae bacterium]MBA4310439.1 phosphatidylserine decarboxylase family protein [Chlorobiaceae bacterium]